MKKIVTFYKELICFPIFELNDSMNFWNIVIFTPSNIIAPSALMLMLVRAFSQSKCFSALTRYKISEFSDFHGINRRQLVTSVKCASVFYLVKRTFTSTACSFCYSFHCACSIESHSRDFSIRWTSWRIRVKNGRAEKFFVIWSIFIIQWKSRFFIPFFCAIMSKVILLFETNQFIRAFSRSVQSISAIWVDRHYDGHGLPHFSPEFGNVN